jgi:hypothetical protein
MATGSSVGNGSGVAVDDVRTVVIPDLEDGSDVAIAGDARRRPAWPFVVAALLVALGLLAIALPGAAPRLRTLERSAPDVSVAPNEQPWSWLARPVPITSRSQSVTLPDGIDLLQMIALGGPVDGLEGVGAIGDGVEVQQVLGEHAVAVDHPSGSGPAVVVYVPEPLVTAILVPGQLVTFQGTLMPTPGDFSAMAGPEAAATAGTSGVYVAAVPATVDVLATTVTG